MATIQTSTFISDSVIFIRDYLQANVADPISNRATNEKFVMTSYPERPVKYPIITVKITNISDIRRLGMRSELHWMRLPVEIRIWARNVKEKDELSQLVFNTLRANQFGGGNSTSDDKEMHDFVLRNSIDIDEEGRTGIKSRVFETEYTAIIGG